MADKIITLDPRQMPVEIFVFTANLQLFPKTLSLPNFFLAYDRSACVRRSLLTVNSRSRVPS
jgi:hypothetical protein